MFVGRAVVVGLGVLALMAAPSWAAKGGNSANAALCAPGGYAGALLAQDGSAFTNEGKCTSYAAKGGQLVGVNAVGEPPVGGSFNEVCSGFGLAGPNALCGAQYIGTNTTIVKLVGGPVEASGTWSFSISFPCVEQGIKVTGLLVEGNTAEGALVERGFPPPSGC
jgi:hypothetical protein